MDEQEIIDKIREFNRFYMPALRLLGNHYLGGEYSATEVRIFYELYHNVGCNAAFLVQQLNIDKSYLSKILAGYEKKGYIERVQSKEDRRSYNLYLTEAGKAREQEFDKKASAEVGVVIERLSAKEKATIYKDLVEVMALLRKGNRVE